MGFVIGGFRSILGVSVFQGSLLGILVMMTAAKNAIVKAAFELKSSHVCEKRSKCLLKPNFTSSVHRPK